MSEDRKGMRYRPILDVARETIKYIDDRRKGKMISLKTPWKKFNKACMGGIEWNSITTIAAMSGSGKTTMINQLETGLKDLNPEQNFSILSFNFEMLAMKLVGRKLSHAVKRTTSELYSANDNVSDELYNDLVTEAKRLSKYDIQYVDTPGTVAQIKSTILSYCLTRQDPKNEGGDPDHGVVVMLDHVLLVNGKDGDAERRILFELMTMFNNLKKSLKVSFIVLSQLNRDIETSDRIQNPDLQYPRKADLFGSDAMYMFSDIVLVPHRPEMLGISKYGPKFVPTKDKIFHHYLKMREGEPFVAVMINNLKHNEVLDGD